jgi:hypothetical protein
VYAVRQVARKPLILVLSLSAGVSLGGFLSIGASLAGLPEIAFGLLLFNLLYAAALRYVVANTRFSSRCRRAAMLFHVFGRRRWDFLYDT